MPLRWTGSRTTGNSPTPTFNAPDKSPFSAVPLGFSPYTFEVAGYRYMFIWQMVIGDFDAFKAAKHAALGPNELLTTDRLVLGVQ